jgi:hypothetical protein
VSEVLPLVLATKRGGEQRACNSAPFLFFLFSTAVCFFRRDQDPVGAFRAGFIHTKHIFGNDLVLF